MSTIRNPQDAASESVRLSGSDANRPLPSSPLNLPNIITLSRLALSVVLFWMIDKGTMWVASSIVFLVAAATDALDGFIARRYGMVTKLGRVLDPFVDKVIVCGAFIFLLTKPNSGVTSWMAITVIGREMFVTSLRSFLEQEGKDFSASWSGKIKMVLQCAAVMGSLLSLSPEFGERLVTARDVTLWLAVAVTLYSGYVYIIRAISLFRQPTAGD